VHKELEAISDAKLFGQIAGKDAGALAELYDRYSARLYGLALKILKDRTLTEDVIQDLFMYVWQQAGRFDDQRGHPVVWLMVLCRNRCIDKLRSHLKKAQRQSEIDEKTLMTAATDESENPLHNVHLKEVSQNVKGALAALPEEQRDPIEMAYFEGMSQTEISATLDVPLGTIKTRVRLGMKKLRDLIKET